VKGEERLLDVANVDGTPYMGIASFGFDSDANRIANEAKRVKGDAVYIYAALRALSAWKAARFTVTVDGERHEFTGYTVAVQPPAASSSSEGGSPTSDSTTSLTTFALCPILELTLGPLDANLLGLLVHLDQVHLTLVANSDGGILGSLFCSVFNGG